MIGHTTNPKCPIDVDPANAAAFDAWNGPDGHHWAANAEAFDAALARYRQPFLEATRITSTDRVLDIGCGNGQSTLDAARLAANGRAVGVDLSAPMLDVARRRATSQRVTNVEFLHGDAQVHPFEPGSFDTAISHTGAMFFGDQTAAFANIARALRPGAQLTLLVWQTPLANQWFTEPTGILAHGRALTAPPLDAPGPFSLSDPTHVRGLLEANGFRNVTIDDRREPMWFGNTAEEALRFITDLGVFAALLKGLAAAAHDAALTQLRASLSAHHTGEGVQYDSAMWLITATRL